jgi:2'-5' RNA ligase
VSDPDNVIRAFIALEINEDVRRSLGALQAELKESGAQVSWVRPENIHLTLVFLGNVFEALVGPLSRRLDAIAAEISGFSLQVSGTGTFGSKRHPRVVWAGIEGVPPELEELHGKVAAAVRELDVPLENRPFRAHLTLGRVRSSRNVDALTSAVTSAKNTRHGAVDVRRVLLMRSRLDPQGAQYSILHESALKGE